MLLSVPGVLLALAAAGYIMLAIATEPGYRNGFLGYGIGYLPKNGPFMRTSAGIGFSFSENVELRMAAVPGPMITAPPPSEAMLWFTALRVMVTLATEPA